MWQAVESLFGVEVEDGNKGARISTKGSSEDGLVCQETYGLRLNSVAIPYLPSPITHPFLLIAHQFRGVINRAIRLLPRRPPSGCPHCPRRLGRFVSPERVDFARLDRVLVVVQRRGDGRA